MVRIPFNGLKIISEKLFISCFNLNRRWLNTMTGKVIVRRIDGENEMALSFKYSSPLIAEREFNFNRKQNEQVKISLIRIAQNIGKIAEKKLKKAKNKETKDESTSNAVPRVSLVTMNGSEVDDTTSTAVAFSTGAILRVGEKEFRVDVNPPMVKSLSLPKHVMAGFNVYPKLEVEFTDIPNCNFVWFKSESRFNSEGKNSSTDKVKMDVSRLKWQPAGEGFFYRTNVDDIGRYLKLVCTPVITGREGPSEETISPQEVTSGPGETPFERRQVFTRTRVEDGSFRVVTYNILADLYADSDFSRSTLFPSCPPYALSIDYRKQLLLNEITGYNADIVCLQEVDHKVFQSDLSFAMSALGMEGRLASKGGKVAEGLACFYNKNKFNLVSNHCIELSQAIFNDVQFKDFANAVNANRSLKVRLTERTTVLQVLTLECKDVPGKSLLVANTHLYFHPNADHIRLLQAGICLRYLDRVMADEVGRKPGEVALIFCGDFNSTPESGVYELMTTRYIPEDFDRWKSVPEESVEGLSLTHPYNLISACGCPDYTNYTTGFVGCLDYIFADDRLLTVEEVVPLPSHEEVTQFGALPSLTFPSDHISLACTLRWKT